MKVVGCSSCCGSPNSVTEDSRQGRVCGHLAEMFVASNRWSLTTIVDDIKLNRWSVIAAKVIEGRACLACLAGVMGMLPPITNLPYTGHKTQEGF